MPVTTTSSIDSSQTPALVAPIKTARPVKLAARWVEFKELKQLQVDWEKLSEQSLWTNPAFEPNYLIPALQHLGNDSVQVLVVKDDSKQRENRLVGLIPVETKRIYGLPFKAAEIWKHDQCFDTTPLLHEQFASQAWKVICLKLKNDGFKILSLDTVAAEPSVDTVFGNVESDLKLLRFQRDLYRRAAFVPGSSIEEYKQAHVSKSIRKNIKRAERRLGEVGMIEFHLSTPDSDFEQLTNEFLRIESSGWKGEEGTALASNSKTESFYRDMIRESSRSGKARFLSMKVDGVTIAMLSDIKTGGFVCSYKTAYDDSFSKYSPGQQLEVKNLDFLYQEGISLGDSCTSPDNSTINRIWGQKLSFQNLIISLTPGVSRAAIRSLPLIQSVVHKLRSNSKH